MSKNIKSEYTDRRVRSIALLCVWRLIISINSHFKLETKLMIAVFVFPILLAFLIAELASSLFAPSEVDICLDTGGSYNYELCKCDYKLNHKYNKDNQC